ncbi:MAG: PLP-dependent aminotransferase family protein [Chitinispirillales bacterium]|jgi:DNA-binding transcriptional MocR family regulator|nr:PLP-dependent aminotransferase family protein [Chitinispirillales bacterium]
MSEHEYNFSASARGMRASEIRRIMKLAGDPSLISFAGGAPALSLLPADIVDAIYGALPEQVKRIAMQYGATDGYPPLIAEIKKYLASKNISMDGQELIVTTGAQQAINVLAKIFTDPGDAVITESPSFIGALAAFKSYGAETVGVPMDDEGIIIPQLLEALDKWGKKAKILYLTPYFHNPAGIIYSVNRKRQLLDALAGREIILLEDDPYGELYFDDADKPLTVPMKSMPHPGVTICYAGSFAKIFSPGMRLGWLCAPAGIIDKCQLAKQSIDACSPVFTQALASEFLSQNKMPAYIETLRAAYKRRAGIMLDSLKQHMPAGVNWTVPKGGFYVWVTLPEYMNASEVFEAAYKNGAAFVIGSAFDPAGVKNDCLRLAFSSTPEDKIAQGIEIVANAIKSCIK